MNKSSDWPEKLFIPVFIQIDQITTSTIENDTIFYRFN